MTLAPSRALVVFAASNLLRDRANVVIQSSVAAFQAERRACPERSRRDPPLDRLRRASQIAPPPKFKTLGNSKTLGNPTQMASRGKHRTVNIQNNTRKKQ